MAKPRAIYICDNCGKEYSGWQGQCDVCGEWNTIVEQKIASTAASAFATGSVAIHEGNKPQSLAQINKIKQERLSTNISELDRVLGGGVIPGSVILISGEPGVGKSTLLVQLGMEIGSKGTGVTYISEEESLPQIGDRARRLLKGELKTQEDLINKHLELVNLYNLEQILHLMRSTKSQFVILDSIQTIASGEVRGVPGGMSQVKYCAAELTTTAKQLGKTLIMIGHINKEGGIAGPKILEHLVDVVLHFAGEQKSLIRVLRPQKNRFGSIDEIGIFTMDEGGLVSVKNPAQLFADAKDVDNSSSAESRIGNCYTVVMEGVRPLVVNVQALAVPTTYAYPKRVVEGVSAARVQLICAVLSRYLKVKLYENDIYINVAQGLKVQDRAIDLAIAAAIYSSIKGVPISRNLVIFGEMNLTGRVTEVSFFEKRAKEAKLLGYNKQLTAKELPFISSLAKAKL
jgi:DNA repair protein RadA/Sms